MTCIVNWEKCLFDQKEIKFLGHVVGDDRMRMDHQKVKDIQDWEIQTKVPKLCSFFGLPNYYCRFIAGYSAIVVPLTELLKKDQKWEWEKDCQKAFETLKEAMMKEPVL